MTTPDGDTRKPAKRRLPALLGALISFLCAVVLWSVVATASSIYGGTGRVHQDDDSQRDVTATVQSCTRQGPISLNGLGFWWTCRVTIGAGTVEVRHSVATEADVGRTVRVHELCADTDYTDCKYGRPSSIGWAGLIDALHLIEDFILPLLLFLSVVDLTRYFRSARGRKRTQKAVS
jgi:Family of unknown function (DUF6346)